MNRLLRLIASVSRGREPSAIDYNILIGFFYGASDGPIHIPFSTLVRDCRRYLDWALYPDPLSDSMIEIRKERWQVEIQEIKSRRKRVGILTHQPPNPRTYENDEEWYETFFGSQHPNGQA